MTKGQKVTTVHGEEGGSMGELEWVEGDKSEKIGVSSDKDQVLHVDDGNWQGSVCMEVTGSREVRNDTWDVMSE